MTTVDANTTDPIIIPVINTINELEEEQTHKKQKVQEQAQVQEQISKNYKIIFDCIKEDDFANFEKAILCANNDEISNALLVALSFNRCRMARFILSYEQNLNLTITDKNQNSLLHWACFVDAFDIVKLLIERGTDINHKNYIGETPIFTAVFRNNIRILELFYTNKADLSIIDSHGNNLIHYAIENNNNLSTIMMLIAFEIDLTVINLKGNDILLTAVENDEIEIFKLLIKFVKLNNKTNNKNKSVFYYLLKNKEFDLVNLLINGYNYPDFYLLNYAIECNNLDLFTKMLNLGVVINKYIIMNAVKFANIHIIRLLIKHNCDFNFVNSKSNSMLMCAIYTNNLELVDLIASRTLDLNYINPITKNNALTIAIMENFYDIAEYLLNKKCEPHNLLILAATKNNLISLQLLLKFNADVSATSIKGNTAFTAAASKNYIPILNELIDHVKDKNQLKKIINMQNSMGRTALMYAACNGYFEIVQILISHGADISIESNEKFTAIDYARIYNHTFLKRYLKTELLAQKQTNCTIM